ncbi:MAG TPA: hypothetical protein DCY20_08180 [Firmicutes bacterium]|nr:hypothetical protein [Bacillota bacterium]
MRRSLYCVETKIAFGIIAVTLVLFLLSITYQPHVVGLQYVGIIAFRLLESLMNVAFLFILIYPAYILKKIAPNVSNVFDEPAITSFLPLSKKQLFWNGIKGWIIFCPIYIFLAIYLYLVAKTYIDSASFGHHQPVSFDFHVIRNGWDQLLDIYVMRGLFIIHLFLVFMANTIIHFATAMSKGKYIALNIVTFMLVLVTTFLGYARFETFHEGFWLITIFIILVTYFIYAFKKLEYIYQ